MKKKIILNIEGMHCPMCEKNLSAALKETEGVKKAKVSLADKTATVVYDDGKTGEEQIRAAVKDAGYQVL
ncbi:MAG: heavy-metal-associated domain-containing protein [Oscillospiraceae bacterium]|jgi:copper chaperone CopZ|nr:heavy-metal-associated domain-containing protein [Oscillospiraceae bacterium]